jgi:Na+-driven multidrug efflux pump
VSNWGKKQYKKGQDTLATALLVLAGLPLALVLLAKILPLLLIIGTIALVIRVGRFGRHP